MSAPTHGGHSATLRRQWVDHAIGQISAVKVAPDGSTGIVADVYQVTGAETPTTAGLFGNALYTVDARFGSMTGPYKAFRVELN